MPLTVSPEVLRRHLPIVYLDQWVWIRLARAAHGHADAADTVEALRKLRELVAANLIVCPLSNVHYMETQAHYVEARRIRLGMLMLELGRLRTLAPSMVVVPWEIDCALSRRFGRPSEASDLPLLGVGAGHAFGKPLELAIGRLLDETYEDWARRKVQAQYLFEVGAITGVRGDGPLENLAGHNAISMRYAKGETDLAEKMRAAGITGAKRDDVLIADEIVDILRPLQQRMQAAGVTWEEFAGLGRQGITEFLEDLPSRSVALALRRERHANPNEHWKEGDLHDIASLSVAVAYCDVLVIEKHAHALLTRSGIAERFGATLLRRPSELCSALDRALPKGAEAAQSRSRAPC